MFDALRNDEFLDMQEKGYFEADSTDPTKLVLSESGINHFERLVESLPAKAQVLVRQMVAGNVAAAPEALKAFMQ